VHLLHPSAHKSSLAHTFCIPQDLRRPPPATLVMFTCPNLTRLCAGQLPPSQPALPVYGAGDSRDMLPAMQARHLKCHRPASTMHIQLTGPVHASHQADPGWNDRQGGKDLPGWQKPASCHDQGSCLVPVRAHVFTV